jgi:hypothetical protein
MARVKPPKPDMAPLAYGVVAIIAGRHKGQLGFYDDDESGDRIIVFLGTPFASDPVILRRSDVRQATDEERLSFELDHMNDIRYAQATKRLRDGDE